MTAEIRTNYTPGATLAAVCMFPNGQTWAGGNTSAARTNVTVIAHPIAMTEDGNTGLYAADFPTVITTPGDYSFEIYQTAGSLSLADVQAGPVAVGSPGHWNGASIDPSNYLTGDAYARLGNPAGASVSADIAVVEGHAASADTSASATQTLLNILSGLIGHNSGLRNTVYDGSGNLLTADLCSYDSPTNATTNNGATGIVHKWTLTSTIVSGNQTAQTIAQVS